MRTLVSPRAETPLRPIDADGLRVTGGFWAERLATNRERSIPHGLAQLEASGALDNFRHAARGSGRYVGGLTLLFGHVLLSILTLFRHVLRRLIGRFALIAAGERANAHRCGHCQCPAAVCLCHVVIS